MCIRDRWWARPARSARATATCLLYTSRLTVYQGVPKADKLELLAQKLTELGVTRLVPVEMERSVRHFEKVERLRKIAREAAKQCRRALPMEITEPMPCLLYTSRCV